MSRFTRFSRGKIWFVNIGPCKRFDIFQLWSLEGRIQKEVFTVTGNGCNQGVSGVFNNTRDISYIYLKGNIEKWLITE